MHELNKTFPYYYETLNFTHLEFYSSFANHLR